MRVKHFAGSMTAAASALLWTVAAGAAPQHPHTPPAGSRPAAQAATPEKTEQALKVGKKGDVEFRVQTVVGEMKFKAGRYLLQHRVDGDAHFVHFTEISKGRPQGHARVGYGRDAPLAHPGEVQCRLEPLDEKVSTTAIYAVQEGEASRVTKVFIRGENVAHVF